MNERKVFHKNNDSSGNKSGKHNTSICNRKVGYCLFPFCCHKHAYVGDSCFCLQLVLIACLNEVRVYTLGMQAYAVFFKRKCCENDHGYHKHF